MRMVKTQSLCSVTGSCKVNSVSTSRTIWNLKIAYWKVGGWHRGLGESECFPLSCTLKPDYKTNNVGRKAITLKAGDLEAFPRSTAGFADTPPLNSVTQRARAEENQGASNQNNLSMIKKKKNGSVKQIILTYRLQTYTLQTMNYIQQELLADLVIPSYTGNWRRVLLPVNAAKHHVAHFGQGCLHSLLCTKVRSI